MPRSDVDVDVVVVGGGAAGIAAARRLHEAAVDCLIVEARPRLGGRAWTVIDESGYALDLADGQRALCQKPCHLDGLAASLGCKRIGQKGRFAGPDDAPHDTNMAQFTNFAKWCA